VEVYYKIDVRNEKLEFENRLSFYQQVDVEVFYYFFGLIFLKIEIRHYITEEKLLCINVPGLPFMMRGFRTR
jgi:hypothetical protein